MSEILENVKVFAQSCRNRRQSQGYDNTSTFSSKTAKLKIKAILTIIYCITKICYNLQQIDLSTLCSV